MQDACFGRARHAEHTLSSGRLKQRIHGGEVILDRFSAHELFILTLFCEASVPLKPGHLAGRWLGAGGDVLVQGFGEVVCAVVGRVLTWNRRDGYPGIHKSIKSLCQAPF